jgi:hypothetical protein
LGVREQVVKPATVVVGFFLLSRVPSRIVDRKLLQLGVGNRRFPKTENKNGRYETMIDLGDLFFVVFAVGVSVVILAIYRILDYGIRRWLMKDWPPVTR